MPAQWCSLKSPLNSFGPPWLFMDACLIVNFITFVFSNSLDDGFLAWCICLGLNDRKLFSAHSFVRHGQWLPLQFQTQSLSGNSSLYYIKIERWLLHRPDWPCNRHPAVVCQLINFLPIHSFTSRHGPMVIPMAYGRSGEYNYFHAFVFNRHCAFTLHPNCAIIHKFFRVFLVYELVRNPVNVKLIATSGLLPWRKYCSKLVLSFNVVVQISIK